MAKKKRMTATACAFCDKAKVLNFAAIELDDEVVFEVGDGHIFARGESGHLSRLFFGIDFEVAGDLERRIGQRRDDGIDFLATFAQRDDIFGADLEAGDVDFAAVDEDMAVVDELAGGWNCAGITGTENDVVETTFEELDQTQTRIDFAAESGFHVVDELAFAQAIVQTNFLFFVEVLAVFASFMAVRGAMFTGSIRFLFGDRFRREAGKYHAEATKNFDAWSCVTTHCLFLFRTVAQKKMCEFKPFCGAHRYIDLCQRLETARIGMS